MCGNPCGGGGERGGGLPVVAARLQMNCSFPTASCNLQSRLFGLFDTPPAFLTVPLFLTRSIRVHLRNFYSVVI